jgi:hypothetical protein
MKATKEELEPIYAILKKPTISEKEVEKSELAKGIREELEHTDNKLAAKVIALHHLASNPFYYSMLEMLHSELSTTMQDDQPESASTPAEEPEEKK